MNNQDEILLEESRRIRLLRICVDLTIQLFLTTAVTPDQADKMIRGLRDFSLKLFPGKGHVFDLIYLPRFRRALVEAGMKDTPDILTAFEEITDRCPEQDS